MKLWLKIMSIILIVIFAIIAFGVGIWLYHPLLDKDIAYEIAYDSFSKMVSNSLQIDPANFVALQYQDDGGDHRIVTYYWKHRDLENCVVEVYVDRRDSNARPILQCAEMMK